MKRSLVPVPNIGHRHSSVRASQQNEPTRIHNTKINRWGLVGTSRLHACGSLAPHTLVLSTNSTPTPCCTPIARCVSQYYPNVAARAAMDTERRLARSPNLVRRLACTPEKTETRLWCIPAALVSPHERQNATLNFRGKTHSMRFQGPYVSCSGSSSMLSPRVARHSSHSMHSAWHLERHKPHTTDNQEQLVLNANSCDSNSSRQQWTITLAAR
jgi:hypothetical protein